MVVLVRPVRLATCLILIISLLLSSGCWSRREMENLAYILVLGIDLTPEGNVKLFAQVGLPSTDPGGGEEPLFETITAEGRNINDALDRMFLESTKRPFLSHLRLVIFSENLAREGLWHVLDFLRRDISVRANIRTAVTTQDLEELLSVEEPLSSQPSLSLANQFNVNIQRSAVVDIELMDLVAQVLEPDREAAMPVIQAGEDIFILGKTAVFKGDQLLTILEREETFGLSFWRDEVNGGVFTVAQHGKEDVVSFRITSSSSKLTTKWDGKTLHVRIDTDTVVDVSELHGDIQVDLENLASRHVFQRMEDVLNVARREESDFLGIAVSFRRKNPQVWKELQQRWEEVLRSAKYDINTRVHIRGQGQIR